MRRHPDPQKRRRGILRRMRLQRDEIVVDGNVVHVPLPNGLKATVDKIDWDAFVCRYTWCIHFPGGRPYAYAADPYSDDRTHVSMHRLVAAAPRGTIVDHINGNSLDNRRANLRVATQRGNNRNRRVLPERRSSQFKGVTLDKRRGKWFARIKVNGKTRHLGAYVNESDAARAYDAAAIEFFGEFAATNAMLGRLPPVPPAVQHDLFGGAP